MSWGNVRNGGYDALALCHRSRRMEILDVRDGDEVRSGDLCSDAIRGLRVECGEFEAAHIFAELAHLLCSRGKVVARGSVAIRECEVADRNHMRAGVAGPGPEAGRLHLRNYPGISSMALA